MNFSCGFYFCDNYAKLVPRLHVPHIVIVYITTCMHGNFREWTLTCEICETKSTAKHNVHGRFRVDY